MFRWIVANLDKFKLLPVFLGGLFTFFLTWLKERDAINQRTRVLSEATQRLQFWKEWAALADTQKLAPLNNSLLELELRRSAQLVRETYLFWPLPLNWTANTYKAYLHHVGFLRRWFLLHAMPTPELAEKHGDFRLAVIMFVVFYLLAVFDPIAINLAHQHPGSLVAQQWLVQNAPIEAHPRRWAVILGGLAMCSFVFLWWQWLLTYAGTRRWLGENSPVIVSLALRSFTANQQDADAQTADGAGRA